MLKACLLFLYVLRLSLGRQKGTEFPVSPGNEFSLESSRCLQCNYCYIVTLLRKDLAV